MTDDESWIKSEGAAQAPSIPPSISVVNNKRILTAAFTECPFRYRLGARNADMDSMGRPRRLADGTPIVV